MPKLADLLCQSVNNNSDFDSAWYVQFAYNLQMDIPQAQNLFKQYGKGYIYAQNGTLVMPDTPRHRNKMVRVYGDCVVVAEDGTTFVRTPRHIGARNRRHQHNLMLKYEREQRQEYSKLMEQRRLDQLFHDAAEKRPVKRGGKGDSHADIGRYNNFPKLYEKISNDLKFVQIKINI